MYGCLGTLAGLAMGPILLVLFFVVWMRTDNLLLAAFVAVVALLGSSRSISRWVARRTQRQQEAALAALAGAALLAGAGDGDEAEDREDMDDDIGVGGEEGDFFEDDAEDEVEDDTTGIRTDPFLEDEADPLAGDADDLMGDDWSTEED